LKYLFTVIDEFSRFPFAFAVDRPTTEAAVIVETIAQLHGHTVFSRLDMKAAYHQVPITKANQIITT